ncbi:MAG: inositol-3-phosphate synthase [Candidatus Altiarchaeales archaeon]|nr:inositol-3-phosphate synthase [Candidatus Altiarchaeales archaeon]MBD3416951.1 inositol-3-phosphate synthase [Candidatus Altiarchaeales archaeon]
MANKDIKVAIIGVGNCASSLIQGVEYYKGVRAEDPLIPGLMHNSLGGYMIKDMRFVAAFDVDSKKVGSDLSEAVFAEPNCTVKFSDVPRWDVEVKKGPVLDGVADTTREKFTVDPKQAPVNVAKELEESGADVAMCYLPVGSEEAARFYAGECVKAGVAFVNAMPVFICSTKDGDEMFREAGLPCIGDDIKSQVGATIVHRTLTRLFVDRGVKLDHTYQLNVGGNTDFLNMLERTRLKSKKISKTQSVQSQLPTQLPPDDIHIGPSDYVPWLDDKKLCFIRMEGRKFGDVPLNIELRLDVEDSPNSAGVMVDAIRCIKLALDRGVSGTLTSPSSYFMKSPMIQYTDSVAREMVEEFIKGERER